MFVFTSESHVFLDACGTRRLHQLLQQEWTRLSRPTGTFPSLTRLEAGLQSEQKTPRGIIIEKEFGFPLLLKMQLRPRHLVHLLVFGI